MPWILWLLAAVPVWLVWRRRQLAREAMAFPPLQLREVAARTSAGGRVLLALEAAILALVLVALAGPMETHEVELFDEEGIDLALVLDISTSMQAADFPPNRLEALKRIASDMVRKSGGHRIGVYAFAGICVTQVPFTTDTTAVIDLIDALSVESFSHARTAGTAVGDALLVATSDLVKIRTAGRDQVVVLVTDGESQTGSDPILAARYLKQERVRFYAIGVGKDEPIPVWINGKPLMGTNGKQYVTQMDDAQLKQITAEAQGSYYRADSADVLNKIFDEISRLEHKPLQVQGARVERSHRAYVAFALVGLLALWLALDGLWLRRPLR
jgi:Ca-activated chloride channel family protein